MFKELCSPEGHSQDNCVSGDVVGGDVVKCLSKQWYLGVIDKPASSLAQLAQLVPSLLAHPPSFIPICTTSNILCSDCACVSHEQSYVHHVPPC